MTDGQTTTILYTCMIANNCGSVWAIPYAYRVYRVLYSMIIAYQFSDERQGSAPAGWEWSAPTTTQLFFLPPLKLKIAYVYHHSERIICHFSLQLSHHSDHSGQNPGKGHVLSCDPLLLSSKISEILLWLAAV